VALLHLLGYDTDVLTRQAVEVHRIDVDNRRASRRRSAISGHEFNLNKCIERDTLKDFRFILPDLARVDRLCFSNEAFRVSRGRYSISCAFERLCVVLRRLATPCHWENVERGFGRHSPALCEIFYESVDELLAKFEPCVLTFLNDLILSRAAE
jgi:hypothetical protein